MDPQCSTPSSPPSVGCCIHGEFPFCKKMAILPRVSRDLSKQTKTKATWPSRLLKKSHPLVTQLKQELPSLASPNNQACLKMEGLQSIGSDALVWAMPARQPGFVRTVVMACARQSQRCLMQRWQI